MPHPPAEYVFMGNTPGPSPVDEHVIETWNRVLSLLNLGQLPDGINERNLYVVINALLDSLESRQSRSVNGRGSKRYPAGTAPASLSNARPAAAMAPPSGIAATPRQQLTDADIEEGVNLLLGRPSGTRSPAGG